MLLIEAKLFDSEREKGTPAATDLSWAGPDRRGLGPADVGSRSGQKKRKKFYWVSSRTNEEGAHQRPLKLFNAHGQMLSDGWHGAVSLNRRRHTIAALNNYNRVHWCFAHDPPGWIGWIRSDPVRSDPAGRELFAIYLVTETDAIAGVSGEHCLCGNGVKTAAISQQRWDPAAHSDPAARMHDRTERMPVAAADLTTSCGRW